MDGDPATRTNNLGLHIAAWVNLTNILWKKEVRPKVCRLHESNYIKFKSRSTDLCWEKSGW